MIPYIHGYFCDGICQNVVPDVLSQKGTNHNGVPGPPSLTEYCVTMHSGTFFKKSRTDISIYTVSHVGLLYLVEHIYNCPDDGCNMLL
jgi:hypothetical protein